MRFRPGTLAPNLSRWLERSRHGVQSRITLLVTLTGVAFLTLLWVGETAWRAEFDHLLRERVGQNERTLNKVLALRSEGPRAHVEDYTRWDDLCAFVRAPNARWGRLNITQTLPTFGLDAAWVLNDRFELVFATGSGNDSSPPAVPVPIESLAAALRSRPVRHFFATTGRGLFEVWTSSIQPTEDVRHTGPISGYYVVARQWSPEFQRDLAQITGGTVRLAPGKSRAIEHSPSVWEGLITVASPAPGLDGTPIVTIVLRSTYEIAPEIEEVMKFSMWMLAASITGILVAMGWALSTWIGRPLGGITRALQEKDPGPLHEARRRRDEIGTLSQLVEDFFAQQHTLIEARETAEAARAAADAAREAADTAANAKSQFLANVSHELRTPMHGILSYARFGLRGGADTSRDEILEYFRNIQECGTSLLGLLDDLLDLARLEAGRMKFEFERGSLLELVGTAVDEFATFFHERAMRVDVIADESSVEPVRCDRRKLLQVIRNLLSNAGKFSTQGGTVRVILRSAEGRASIAVEDDGKGLPPGELESIFDKFVQASNRSASTGGTGLGLAICREILLAHEGRVWAENRAEGGARFTLELPIDGPAGATEDAPAGSDLRLRAAA